MAVYSIEFDCEYYDKEKEKSIWVGRVLDHIDFNSFEEAEAYIEAISIEKFLDEFPFSGSKVFERNEDYEFDMYMEDGWWEYEGGVTPLAHYENECWEYIRFSAIPDFFEPDWF